MTHILGTVLSLLISQRMRNLNYKMVF